MGLLCSQAGQIRAQLTESAARSRRKASKTFSKALAVFRLARCVHQYQNYVPSAAAPSHRCFSYRSNFVLNEFMSKFTTVSSSTGVGVWGVDLVVNPEGMVVS
eukprot:2384400-Amphidinium_carterae.1